MIILYDLYFIWLTSYCYLVLRNRHKTLDLLRRFFPQKRLSNRSTRDHFATGAPGALANQTRWPMQGSASRKHRLDPLAVAGPKITICLGALISHPEEGRPPRLTCARWREPRVRWFTLEGLHQGGWEINGRPTASVKSTTKPINLFPAAQSPLSWPAGGSGKQRTCLFDHHQHVNSSLGLFRP